MKRLVDVLYGLKGYPNAARFTAFKTDLFTTGTTPTITVDTINEQTTDHGVIIEGVTLKDGTITITAPLIHSVDAAVTAHAGGTKAAATALTEEINIITTCATAGDSVLLPAAAVGQQLTVVNLGAAALYVYGAGTNTIDDIATANPFIMQVEDVVVFNCYTTAKWQSDSEADGVYDRIYVDTIAENTSATGVTIDGVLLKDGYGTFTLAAAGTVTIDGATTKHTGATALDINLDVNSASSTALDIDVDVDTALSGSEYGKGIYVDILSAAADADGSGVYGYDTLITSTALSKADLVGHRVIIAGTESAAAGTVDVQGFALVPTLILNSASATYKGINVDCSGMTNTACAASYGLYINSNMTTAGCTYGAYVTDGTRTVGLVSPTLAVAITGSTKITGTGVTAGHILEIDATALTTGSLLDYVGITTKVGGYLFNGSMTTSTLTDNFLADDFGVTCNHDGVGNDTLRMIRRTWSGALPNGTLAADFAIAEFSYSGTAGTAASKTGSLTGVKIDLGSATINDASLSVYGLYIDPTVTNTLSAGLYGIYEPGGGVPYIPLQVGTKANTAGSGLKLSGLTDNSGGVQLYFDDGGASVAGEVLSPIRARMLITVNQTAGSTVCGSFSQIVSLGTTGATKNVTGSQLYAAYIFNQVGALTMTASANVAGINQAITVAGNTTVDTTSTFCGLDINLRGAGSVTPAGNGVVSGLYIRSSETAQWTTAIKIKDAAAPTAIAIGTCTTALDITDASEVTNLFKFNEAAGCILNVDVNPQDDPSDGGLGADACIRVDIGGLDYFIPLFAVERS